MCRWGLYKGESYAIDLKIDKTVPWAVIKNRQKNGMTL